jgi:hypothetical protein
MVCGLTVMISWTVRHLTLVEREFFLGTLLSASLQCEVSRAARLGRIRQTC